MIDFKKYCATSGDIRNHLQTPTRCAEGIIATNGHILICVPDDGQEHYPATKESIAETVAKFKSTIGDPDRQWVYAKAIHLPEPIKCRHCDGVGYTYETDCEDCDGDGEFEYGSHTYECKNCEGSGKIESHKGSPEHKQECYSCDGTGQGFQAVAVGRTFLQRRYLAMLAELPECRLGTIGYSEAVAFTFDGGWGMVMPCRE